MQPWKQQEKKEKRSDTVFVKKCLVLMTMMCLHTTEIVSAPSATPNGRAAASLTNVDSFFSFIFFSFTTFFKRNRRRRQPIGRTCILHSLALPSLMARRTELIIHNWKNPEPRASQHRCALFDQRHWNIRRRSKKEKKNNYWRNWIYIVSNAWIGNDSAWKVCTHSP